MHKLLLFFCRAVRSTVEYGASNWTQRQRLRGKHQTLHSVRFLGTIDNQHFSIDGRFIGFPAHAAFALVNNFYIYKGF